MRHAIVGGFDGWKLAGSLAALLLFAGCGSSPGVVAATQAPARQPAIPQAVPVAVGSDTVQILVRGDAAFPVLIDLIRRSSSTVNVEMYEFTRGDLGDALLVAHQRGVVVTVISDPSETSSEATRVRLRTAGIAVVDYPVRAKMIDHVKLAVIDHRAAVVGGINWGTRSAPNHDFDALIHGPAATNLERVFQRDVVTAGQVTVRIPSLQTDANVVVATTLPQDEIRPLALDLIDRASQRIDLQLFVLTDLGVVQALERAQRRGVAVRVLLDPGQRSSDKAAAQLRGAGVPVRLYHSGGELLHAKALVTDGCHLLFGSANWSLSGFEHNHELDIEIPAACDVVPPFLRALDVDWASADQ